MEDYVSLDDIQPTVISRDLKGKFILLYGRPKVGKTSMSASFPRNLIFATEVGYHAIAGIHAVDIDTWGTFKRRLRELEKATIKNKFDTITIDTVSLLWDLCEKFICSQNDVASLGDIPWGKGYDACKKEFHEALRKITLLGYGLVLICHSDIRVEKDDEGNEVEFVAPALNKRAYAIANQLVDIIGYIGVEFDKSGNSTRKIYTRQTPRVMAGSRYPYMKPEIPFGYQELANALAEAIEQSGIRDGATIVDARVDVHSDTVRPFADVMNEARELFEALPDTAEATAEFEKSIKDNFGSESFRLSYAKESQRELVEAVIVDMKSILAKS